MKNEERSKQDTALRRRPCRQEGAVNGWYMWGGLFVFGSNPCQEIRLVKSIPPRNIPNHLMISLSSFN